MPLSNEEKTIALHGLARDFLDGRVDYERFTRIPDPARAFRLDRMRNLLAKLGNPHESLLITHVAGTKGKGSTSTMLAAVLSAAGYRTGLFTSPHLEKVEERIVLDGRQCSESDFDDLIETVRPVVLELDRKADDSHFEEIGPTYFEILTAMALVYFRRKNATAVVLEVGLGGRLDSTNVCLPKVSVITSISFDHTTQLGNTLQAIAREKAGIIKPGVPVICGVTEEEPRDEIRRIADANGSKLLEMDRDFEYIYQPPTHLEESPKSGILRYSSLPLADTTKCSGQGARTNSLEKYRTFDLSLLGRHQAKNAVLVVATIDELRRQGWAISEEALRQGLNSAFLPARVEVVARHPTVILDSAHNTASMASLVETISASFSTKKRFLIFAATKEKDNHSMMRILLNAFDEIYLTQYTTNPRFVPPEELGQIALELRGKTCPIFSTPTAAWDAVKHNASAEDLICITGSFFLAGEIRRAVELTR
jgi:dihydrofolate synthase/folylpolyglutamate synthase